MARALLKLRHDAGTETFAVPEGDTLVGRNTFTALRNPKVCLASDIDFKYTYHTQPGQRRTDLCVRPPPHMFQVSRKQILVRWTPSGALSVKSVRRSLAARGRLMV